SLELDVLVAIHTSTRRDEVTDDDVLLEAKEIVLRTADRRIREDARGLLERSRRDERLRGERRLRDTEQQRLGRGRRFLPLLHTIVLVAEDLLVDMLALEELRLARIHHADLLKHLADDDADVLVVDLHALQAIHLLHLVEQVFLHG